MFRRGLVCGIAMLFLVACGAGHEPDQAPAMEAGTSAATAEFRVENVGLALVGHGEDVDYHRVVYADFLDVRDGHQRRRLRWLR